MGIETGDELMVFARGVGLRTPFDEAILRSLMSGRAGDDSPLQCY